MHCLLVSAVAALSLWTTAQGLVCYESNYINDPRPRNNTDFEYCVMAPYGLGQGADVSLYGVTKKEDSTAAYDKVFSALSTGPFNFSVLTMCLFERYAMGDQPVEFVFRCFCKEDYCNKAVDMQSYMDRLVDTNNK